VVLEVAGSKPVFHPTEPLEKSRGFSLRALDF
jgi:hypothetical protein